MIVKTKTPATCGEYIQGIWRNEPCLVSAPINLFSEVLIENGSGQIYLQEKAKKLLKDFLFKYSINENLLNKVNIRIKSEIPKSNGFGSSTADLAGLIKALSLFFYVDISDKEIANFIVKVDPTDNVMFKDLTLFNHYTGEILYNFHTSFSGELLILANLEKFVDSIEFGYLNEFNRSESKFKKILDLFNEGCWKQDLSIVGKASTQSALLNQCCLVKPQLDKLIQLVYDSQGKGIIIGHSGNLIGIILGEKFETPYFFQELKKIKTFQNSTFFNFNLIEGGIKSEIRFD